MDTEEAVHAGNPLTWSGAQRFHVCHLQLEAQDAMVRFRQRPRAPEPGAQCPGRRRSLPSLCLWSYSGPISSDVAVHRGDGGPYCSALFQKHPQGPTQESHLPVPCAPLGPVGWPRKINQCTRRSRERGERQGWVLGSSSRALSSSPVAGSTGWVETQDEGASATMGRVFAKRL